MGYESERSEEKEMGIMNSYRVQYTEIKPGGSHAHQDEALRGDRGDVVRFLGARKVLEGSVRVTENIGARSDATGVDIGGLGWNPTPTVRDAAQDELDRVQAETGVHAECGLPIADHCAFCDVCPRDRDRCGCEPGDTQWAWSTEQREHSRRTEAPMSAASLLNAMIAYVVDCNPGGKEPHAADIMVHMVRVTRGLSDEAATEWLAEEKQERFIAQAD